VHGEYPSEVSGEYNRHCGSTITETKDADLVVRFPMQTCRLNKNAHSALNENPVKLPIYKRIRYARLLAGLSAIQLAEIVGVGNDVISRYENNHTTMQGMDVELLKNIALACEQDKHFCMDEYHIFKENSDVYLKKYMRENNLANATLAKKLDVSETTVKNWKRGKCCPSYELWKNFFKNT